MSNKYKNCASGYCRNEYEDYLEDEFKCKLWPDVNLENISEDFDCPGFAPPHRCYDCIYAKEKVYETGTIDEIDYYCTLQDKKLIYRDTLLSIFDPDWPECNINKFVSKEPQFKRGQ